MFFVLEFAQHRFTLIHLRHMESVVFDFDPFTETSKQVTRLFEIRPDASRQCIVSFRYFYRTKVCLGSGLWVPASLSMSLAERPLVETLLL